RALQLRACGGSAKQSTSTSCSSRPHKMFVNCTGKGGGPTVILEAGTGDSSEVWNTVREQIEKFARVCSYDRLGLGKSEKLAVPHTADEIVEDLYELLHAVPVPAP